MEEGILSFCVLKHIYDNICEVVVNEGVEINDVMVDEYHAYLQAYYDEPFALLINKEHTYTYTFRAQQRIAILPYIRAVAVLVYRRSSEIATHALQNVKHDGERNLKVFYDRDEAIAWLHSQLQEASSAKVQNING